MRGSEIRRQCDQRIFDELPASASPPASPTYDLTYKSVCLLSPNLQCHFDTAMAQVLLIIIFTALTLIPLACSMDLAVADRSLHLLVLYYSRTGWTAAVAEQVAAGARLSSFPVDIRTFNVSDANCEDWLWADAVALGSPVYFAAVAAPLKSFLDDLQLKCFGWPGVATALANRVGGAFCTGGQQSSGMDTVRLSLLSSMLSLRMIVIGQLGVLFCSKFSCLGHLTGLGIVKTCRRQLGLWRLGTSSRRGGGHTANRRQHQRRTDSG